MAAEVRELDERLPSAWQPKSEAQKAALRCPAELLLFGGAAGSLKSTTLLVDAIKYHKNPHFRGIIFRKSYPEIEFLIDRTRELYAHTSGRFYEAARQWRWPWGSVLEFRHLENDKDVYKHQGPEYQFVGFDESTHQKEFQIRYLLNSRMRSVQGIPMRMRLATNPGNVGHKWHKDIFHGPKCTHCILRDAELKGGDPQWLPGSRKPGLIYQDAKWSSDGVPMEHSTCFIPGRVTDHNLFLDAQGNNTYARKLRGLPKKLREALLDGCWEAFEGQYFDCFDFENHLIDRDKIGEKSWWPYWVGIDYGFAHATVAYLFTMAPNGHIYVLDEYVIHRRKATDVAFDLKKIWGEYKIKAWYLSHDAFRHDGTDDFSRAEQMSQAASIYFDIAYNDRISGAMLITTLLSENRISISRSCELLPVSLATRVHAEKDPEDVEKVETEDEDDAYDAFRYGVASHINPTQRPQSEIIAEKMANEWSQDPTTAMIQLRMYEAKLAQATPPITYRARGRRSGS